VEVGKWFHGNKLLMQVLHPIGTKVVYKKKDEPDGSTKYKTRIVTKGYAFIPGVHYDESFAPVAQDTSNRTCICVALYYHKDGWILCLIDVSGAFLKASWTNQSTLNGPQVWLNLVLFLKKRKLHAGITCEGYVWKP
jgi:hypothetical protein